MPYLDKNGLSHLWAQIVSRLGNKVDRVDGKGLSTNDYTDEEASKVAAAASLNVVNGTETGAIKMTGATEASGFYAFAEGNLTTASGNFSHAEGSNTIASDQAAHAEGWGTVASAGNAHAEGLSTIASGTNSHAEGSDTIASGAYSHAGGESSEARGRTSFSIGMNSIANKRNVTVIGKNNLILDNDENTLNTQLNTQQIFFNLNYKVTHTEPTISLEEGTVVAESTTSMTPDLFEVGMYVISNFSSEPGYWKILSTPNFDGDYYYATVDKYTIQLSTEDFGNYAFYIGNGQDKISRSNAHTLNWDGTAWFRGNVLVGGTNQDDANAKQLATQEYVNERVPPFTYSTVDLEAGVSPLAEGEVYFVYE